MGSTRAANLEPVMGHQRAKVKDKTKVLEKEQKTGKVSVIELVRVTEVGSAPATGRAMATDSAHLTVPGSEPASELVMVMR